MCGIFGVINDQTNEAAQTILTGLKKLEYRGYDSWGIAIKPGSSDSLLVEKHVGKIGLAQTSLPQGTIAIGHTRWATHGGVTDANAHPHLDCTKKIAVLHNGIVENYQELKVKLLEQGHTFISETDTEIIAHLIEEKLKNQSLKKAVFGTFKELVGSNAIAVLHGKSETIIACRNGSPLVVGMGVADAYVASDVPAFLKFTNNVHFLIDGESVILTKKSILLYNTDSGSEKKFSWSVLDWKVEDAEKGGYPHFLLKEIMEQKKTIPKTAQINLVEIEKTAALIRAGKKIVLAACGTASYCALAAKYFFAQGGIHAESYGAYEFLPFAQFCNSDTVFIAISQSGETADTLIAAKAAKKNGATLVALVNARGSTLERLADITIPVGAGPEIAVVSTKAFTSQLATLYLLSHAVDGTIAKAQQNLTDLGNALEKWLDVKLQKQVVELAKTLMDHEDMYLVGKHLNYPATMEFALKIKEASYIHAEPFAAGELKHGVITLIQKGTPCFVLSSNDRVKHEVLSSAAELKARGGHIVGIAPYESLEFDSLIKTPDAGDLTIFPNVIVGQLLGYYLGVGRGADPDKPRNLAKSVTVK
ncbi:glutamine--fructose-6-phosphate transaminase (isomerizing) [Candidatus Roizmanbacteria bacterium CG_4_10_14_0_8_um_filter_39_9]|uniref:Glutamine--fructose-6-phosphate aminotransferase [isomerizing] n=1 Tax=Candidatus Roizmanbacteria bacterium CG_4_10_14_0_8_um_filter_39_9 TaxID=1974829 RepID=A0A2M7QET2_9BACT|nr:MAG: glutamine--fructose-6-phosphate transaminase (isomerizing) [Candidatus Roizmanbacteria bacterium CG_4_10_14_0_8_um_filter_39_9]